MDSRDTGPRFPASGLGYWLGVFCAAVALATVWVLPVGFVVQVAVTALFALVPLSVLLFWLGRWFEHRTQQRQDQLP